jgi:hypothetical protein
MKQITRAWREPTESPIQASVEGMILGVCDVFDGLVAITSLGQLESTTRWYTSLWLAQRSLSKYYNASESVNA